MLFFYGIWMLCHHGQSPKKGEKSKQRFLGYNEKTRFLFVKSARKPRNVSFLTQNPRFLRIVGYPAAGVISPAVMSPAVISPMVRNPVVINPVVIRPAVVSLAVSSPAVISLTVISPAVMKTGSWAAYRRPICITQISLNIDIG